MGTPSNLPLLSMELAERAVHDLGYEGYRQQTDEIRREVEQELQDQAAYRAERDAEQAAWERENPGWDQMSPADEADWVKEYGPVGQTERAPEGVAAPERGADEEGRER